MVDRDADDVAREEKKARKRWEEDHRLPDGWERYRMLADAIDLHRRMIDLGDHKVRFALGIAGALNAVLFMVAVRVPTAEAIPEWLRGWLAVFLGLYLVLTLIFFFRAITALQASVELRESDVFEPPVPGVPATETQAVGLFTPGEMTRRSREDHRRAWSEVRLSQVNAELAAISHALAPVVRRQYVALQRIFRELKLLTVLAALLMGVTAYFVLQSHVVP